MVTEKLPFDCPLQVTLTILAGVIVRAGQPEQFGKEAKLFMVSEFELPSVTRMGHTPEGVTVVPVAKLDQ